MPASRRGLVQPRTREVEQGGVEACSPRSSRTHWKNHSDTVCPTNFPICVRHLPLTGFWICAGTEAAPSSDRRSPSLHPPENFERACLPLIAGSMVGCRPLCAGLRPEFSRTEQIQAAGRIKSVPFELAACRPCVVPVLNRLIRAPRIAGVAQWQSNGFVNRRSSVQSRPPAPVRFPQHLQGFCPGSHR